MGRIHPSNLQRGMVIIDHKPNGARVLETVRDVIPPVKGETCDGYHIYTQSGGKWCWSQHIPIDIQD